MSSDPTQPVPEWWQQPQAPKKEQGAQDRDPQDSQATRQYPTSQGSPARPTFTPSQGNQSDQRYQPDQGYPSGPGFPSGPGYQQAQDYPGNQGSAGAPTYPANQGFPAGPDDQGAPAPAPVAVDHPARHRLGAGGRGLCRQSLRREPDG